VKTLRYFRYCICKHMGLLRTICVAFVIVYVFALSSWAHVGNMYPAVTALIAMLVLGWSLVFDCSQTSQESGEKSE